jgi:hypothetical protein
MSAREPSWREVATILARQMETHAVCGNHPPHADEPDTCPFCADRAAYAVWVAKSKQPTTRQPTKPTGTVDLMAALKASLDQARTKPGGSVA